MDRCKLDWQQVLDLASKFQPTIARLAPDLLAEMQGIADGVMQMGTPVDNTVNFGTRWVGLLDILALNARSEIALSKWDDGCTSVAWKLPSNTQILAQNWDWRVSIGENLAMVSIAQPSKPKIWMVTEVSTTKISDGRSLINSCEFSLVLLARLASILPPLAYA